MIWCESGGGAVHDVEDLAVFASQLAALGLPARIDIAALPGGLGRNGRFDLAPYLADGPPAEGDRVALIAAHRLNDAKLVGLHRLAGAGPREVIAYGAFPTRQAIVAARAKLSYVFGRDPEVIDLSAPRPGIAGIDAPVFGVARRGTAAPRPRVLLVAPALGEARDARAVLALGLTRRFAAAILTDGRSKHDWVAAHGASVAIYQYGEILPADLAARVDICVTFAPLRGNYRTECLVANLAASGAALVDGSPGHAVAAEHDAFVRGPLDVASLAGFLADEIVPNLGAIAEAVRRSRLAAASRDVGALGLADVPGDGHDGGPADAHGDDPAGGQGVGHGGGLAGGWGRAAAKGRQAAPAPTHGAPGTRARIVFMPTNGVGLGHAQRCSLIAGALRDDRSEAVFAAFPSCTGLLKGYGFDVMPLVPRSALHAHNHENDLPNYLRLRALADGAAALVFDGGYLFDSVCRTVVEKRLAGVWIRRGLWQATQNNRPALDREKVFNRVLVPLEAFDELNASYSRGDHLREVGPVVQRPGLAPERRRALRDDLAARYGTAFGALVVTQLGGGVASDRNAQIQALCGMMERRRDVLHLVVVWPGATLQPGWFGWSRSRVVQTHHAAVLANAADLVVSAAGYNSFHEMLYGAQPTIFVPQTGSFLDDQLARARAAAERELAPLILPHEIMRLEREVARHLDEGGAEAARARLAALDLPEPGNARAAALIEEVVHGDAGLERPAVAHRPAGGR